MSQFNLYLEKVQENRNYQDLEVYDEGMKEVKEMAVKTVTFGLMALMGAGFFQGAKSYADTRTKKIAGTQATELMSYKKGISPQAKKQIYDIIKKNMSTGEAMPHSDQKALRDLLNVSSGNTAVENFIEMVPLAETPGYEEITTTGLVKELYKGLKTKEMPDDFDVFKKQSGITPRQLGI